MAERARLERDGDLGVLVIDNEPLNLVDGEMVRDILAALDETDGCRALLVRAEGKYFTGGVDVKVFKGLSESEATRLTADLLAITHHLEDLPFPTLASVQGLCLTAGLELSLACDMIWAAESAQFGLVETVIGLTPLMGRTQRVAERAGPARAREHTSPRRHQARGPSLPRARRPRRGRRDGRDRRAALRDERPEAGRRDVPCRGSGQGQLQGRIGLANALPPVTAGSVMPSGSA